MCILWSDIVRELRNKKDLEKNRYLEREGGEKRFGMGNSVLVLC